LSDEALRLIAARFVLSEPIRLKLIIALGTGERNVTELVEPRTTRMNVPASTVFCRDRHAVRLRQPD
jgi:hypothetical protein